MNEHGNYTVEKIDKTIYVTFTGMFNAPASAKISKLSKEHIASFNGEGFYLLIDLTHYEGSTPDAHEIGNEHAMWLETQNCLGKAIVIKGQVVLDIVRSQQEFLNKSCINSQVFETEHEAKVWLTSLQENEG